MRIEVRNRCSDFNGYRAALVKSLFNAESGCDFDLDADLDLDWGWQIGVVVGPSGSGKTSIGRQLGEMWSPEWPVGEPIVEAIAPGGEFDRVVGALAAVGLGTVPAWLRPYQALSNGEMFRADLARVIVEAPAMVVIDEFTSVVDRQIARVGALAFGKAWRRTGGRCVLLTCHYDVLDWLQPDWVFDTAKGHFARGCLRRRPEIHLDVFETNWRYWPLFEPHHYLKAPPMPCSTCYVGVIDGEPVAHLGVSQVHSGRSVEARACRLVVMPEWQGAGVGLRFLNWVCELQLRGEGRLRRPVTTLFHTSHPGLAVALRRMPAWEQVSCRMWGQNKAKSLASIEKTGTSGAPKGGYGGHFRAVQGFRYRGAA